LSCKLKHLKSPKNMQIIIEHVANFRINVAKKLLTGSELIPQTQQPFMRRIRFQAFLHLL
jgi:hypothetical protein